MSRISLNGEWHVRRFSPCGEESEYVGEIPGCALYDIIRYEGKSLDEIFYRDNAETVQKYENYDFVYTKTFDMITVSGRMELVFEKLDTYCDIYLNEVHLGYCDNGFISYNFDVSDIIKVGENTLEVRFYSPVNAVRGRLLRPAAFTAERVNTRRIQCTYGWDWTMRFVTCGISRDVYLECTDNEIKIEDVYVYTKSIIDDCAEIGIDIDLSDYKRGGIIDAQIFSPDGVLLHRHTRYCAEKFMRIIMDIPDAQKWYPLGYGKQPLYKLVILCGEKELYATSFGIRIVKILQLRDEKDSDNFKKCLEIKKSEHAQIFDKNTEFAGFILTVNGEKIMCKGGNWVPCEPFTNKDPKEKITKLLTLAKDAGVNMLRVWGGGDFETEHFYDECSRLGIMVTQDFMMACASYPEKEVWFLEQLEKEAEYAVRVIRNKPCLMWWTGDNENATEGCNTDIDYRGRNSAYKAIAPIVYKRDPYREFLPSSPYGGNMYASITAGTTHNTNFLGHFLHYIETADMTDYKDRYKEFRARFIAEEPTMGVISKFSLRRFMTSEDIFGDDKTMWLYHTKTNPYMNELFDYMDTMARKILGDFTDSEDRLFKYKYIQFEWIRFCMEQARREKWFTSGIIFWMYNDCWPAASGWSLVDYYGIPKASYYSFKRSAKTVIGCIDKNAETFSLNICNDGAAQRVKCKCMVLSDGHCNVLFEKEIEIEENVSFTAFELNNDKMKMQDVLLFEVENEMGEHDRAFYKQGALEIVTCNDKLEILNKTDHYIEARAKTYIHVVEFESEAVFEDNYFSMLPGEVRKISYVTIGDSKIEIQAYTLKFD